MNKYFKINNVLYEILFTKDNYIVYTNYDINDEGIIVYGSKYSYINDSINLLETTEEDLKQINSLWGEYLDKA